MLNLVREVSARTIDISVRSLKGNSRKHYPKLGEDSSTRQLTGSLAQTTNGREAKTEGKFDVNQRFVSIGDAVRSYSKPQHRTSCFPLQVLLGLSHLNATLLQIINFTPCETLFLRIERA